MMNLAVEVDNVSSIICIFNLIYHMDCLSASGASLHVFLCIINRARGACVPCERVYASSFLGSTVVSHISVYFMLNLSSNVFAC